MPISQDALLNPNRGSLCSLFLLGSQVCYERKYTRSVRIKLFLLNLAVLYPFSFRAWARVLCVIKTSVIKAFPFQSYCICRFLITGNSMHCNRLLKRPCYCTYNFICSLFQSSGLDIFQSLWLTSSNAVTSLYLQFCFLLIFYFMQSGTDAGSSCFIITCLDVQGSFVCLWNYFLPSSEGSQFVHSVLLEICNLSPVLTLQIPHSCSIFP